jgi:hypothetical protein
MQSDATTFIAPCEACRDEYAWESVVPALIEGTLRLQADVGFVTCWRGHRIRVRRIARPLTAA